MNAKEWINQYVDNENTDCGYNYKDTDGCSYESLNDLLQSGIFKFCGCGRSEDNLQYICNALKHINFRREVYDRKLTSEESWKIIKQDEVKVFGSEDAAYFFYYWSDTQDLTEHGGSVPGWLSDKGKIILEVLETINFDN